MAIVIANISQKIAWSPRDIRLGVSHIYRWISSTSKATVMTFKRHWEIGYSRWELNGVIDKIEKQGIFLARCLPCNLSPFSLFLGATLVKEAVWCGMTEAVKREAGYAGGCGPGWGRPWQLWRVSTWPPGWLILKWVGIEVNLLLSSRPWDLIQ